MPIMRSRKGQAAAGTRMLPAGARGFVVPVSIRALILVVLAAAGAAPALAQEAQPAPAILGEAHPDQDNAPPVPASPTPALPDGATETVDGYLLGPDGRLLLGPDGQPRLASDSAPALPHELSPHLTPGLSPDLSPWGMFMQADWVVKAVMIGLAIASVVTWTVWLVTSLELRAARRRARLARAALAQAGSLGDAVAATTVPQPGACAARDLVVATAHEVRISAGLPADGVKERVASRLERIEVAAQRHATRGTGILATIGSTAPFVGLFGTVWGIMNSFIGISEAQTTNLAVVAPGIAEALLATALGLVAAIPAVVIYNKFTRTISGYRALLGDISAELLRLVSRDLDQRRGTLREAAE